MRYLCLATDYDGTLASDGVVDAPTIAALERLKLSGRKLVLVTGRVLPELIDIFRELTLFDRVVAENGALLYRPDSRESKLLAEAPPAQFIDALKRRQVAPLSVGEAIVATVHPHEAAVLDVIRELGLELQVIFNKGAVMVLPSGANKASGLAAALTEMRLSAHNVVAIGDAENDHALLHLAEFSAAVANALPMLKSTADLVTSGSRGAGVVEVIEEMLDDDIAALSAKSTRHNVLLGSQRDGREATIAPAGVNLLVAGSSGSGKSKLATGVLERLAAMGYQFCIIDPEGDYEGFGDAVTLGTGERAPSADEVLITLDKPSTNVVVNLIGLPLADRPPFFLSLLPALHHLRHTTGRPHWILIDEAHHLLPARAEPGTTIHADELSSMIHVTVHPDLLAAEVLKTLDVVAALGEHASAAIVDACKAIGIDPPSMPPEDDATLPPGQALLWRRERAGDTVIIDVALLDDASAKNTRRRIRAAIEERYTLPAAQKKPS